jgi:hypothetical protein
MSAKRITNFCVCVCFVAVASVPFVAPNDRYRRLPQLKCYASSDDVSYIDTTTGSPHDIHLTVIDSLIGRLLIFPSYDGPCSTLPSTPLSMPSAFPLVVHRRLPLLFSYLPHHSQFYKPLCHFLNFVYVAWWRQMLLVSDVYLHVTMTLVFVDRKRRIVDQGQSYHQWNYW